MLRQKVDGKDAWRDVGIADTTLRLGWGMGSRQLDSAGDTKQKDAGAKPWSIKTSL